MTRPRPPSLCARLAAFFAAAACLSCADRVASGGDATEAGNARVTGVVRDGNGNGVAGAVVEILPSGFDPVAGTDVPDSLTDTTDASGRYRFTRLAGGEYNVLARSDASRTRLSVWGVTLGEDSVVVPDDTLRAPGRLIVPIPETADSGSAWIYVPGSTLRARIDSETRLAGSIALDSVPAGAVPRVEYAKTAESAPMVLAQGVEVRESADARVDAYATWPHSRKVLLNTATGPGALAEGLSGFPLLVRLSSPSFDFSQAAADGSDLRFSAPDGSPLAREIESWDAAAGRAAVWVRLDTLPAGRADLSITMHWGLSQAAGPMRPRAVFDTSAGFAAAWHLSEKPDTGAARVYRDATGAGSDADDHSANLSREGVVGAGRGFDSASYLLAAKPSAGLGLAKGFSISVWFRPEMAKLGNMVGDMLSVGDNFGLRVVGDTLLHVWYWPPVPPPGAKTEWNYLNAKPPAALGGAWHLAMGVFDGAALRLYCDGKEIGSAPAAEPVGLQFPLNVTLGKHGNGKRGHEYAGNLDEPVVHSRARGAEWARLSYENQRPESGFPAFGP